MSNDLHFFDLSPEVCLTTLESTDSGLSSSQVLKRRAKYGANSIPEAQSTPAWKILLSQFNNSMVYILLGAVILSVITGHYVDAYVIIGVIIINAAIGFVQEIRAERAIKSLKKMLIQVAKVLRDGSVTVLDASELIPGDIIFLEEGDNIPADARLLESKNLSCIEAALTGESLPVNKNIETLASTTPLADQSCMLHNGTYVSRGNGKAVVVKTGIHTSVGKIATQLHQIESEPTNFQNKTKVLARQMGILSILSAGLIFFVGYFIRHFQLSETIMITIAALVSAIPEGLPAVLSVVLAIGSHRMAKSNAIVRTFAATETLGAVNTILTDKTGTLTENSLTVERLALRDGTIIKVSGKGYEPLGNFQLGDRLMNTNDLQDLEEFLQASFFCNKSSVFYDEEKSIYTISGDPTEASLMVLAQKAGYDQTLQSKQVQLIDDLPFNSTNKYRASLIRDHHTNKLLLVGAPEKILTKCVLDEAKRIAINEQINTWAGQSFRVVALANKSIASQQKALEEDAIHDLNWLGMVAITDPPRQGVSESISSCKKAGISVVMATGDHKKTATAIAKKLGIINQSNDVENQVYTESELLNMPDSEFDNVVRSSTVFARLSPFMKLKIISSMQKQGLLVAMTGDGVNDAPALKKADIGVAMGKSGTDVAREASQLVLADDNFSTIVKAIEQGRIVFNNTKKTSYFLLTTNFAATITLVLSILVGWPYILSATQILWVNLVTDGFLDITLATERGHGSEMRQKPLGKKENILSLDVIPFIMINSVIMVILTMSAFYFVLPRGIEEARTAAFLTISMTQVFNVFNMRSLYRSAFSIGLFSNKILSWAVLLSFGMQVLVVVVPAFQVLFGFGTLSYLEIITIFALSSFILWIGELYKLLTQKKGNNSTK